MKGTGNDLKMKWTEAGGQLIIPLPNRAGLSRNKLARALGPICLLIRTSRRAWCSGGLFLRLRDSFPRSQSQQGRFPFLSFHLLSAFRAEVF